MELRLASGRPCVVKISVQVERTDEELKSLYEEASNSFYKPSYYYADFDKFCEHNKYKREMKEVNARWHMFAQETEEDSNGNIQYPVAVIELGDGTVRTVSADCVRFIKEEHNE